MDPISRLGLEYQCIFLPTRICALTDKANMMHSLEARSPLLDPSVTQYANNLPTNWKLRGGIGKWLLRRYMLGRLGARVAHKPKQGFTVPLGKWLRAELRPLAERFLTRDAIVSGGLLNANEVERLWQEHSKGRRNHYKQLWTILVAQMWQHRVLGL